MKKYALAAICLVLLLVPLTATAHRTFTDEALADNGSFSDDIHLFKLSEWVRVNFTANKPVDIYIMTTTDYGAGSGSRYPTNFTALYQVLNTTSTFFTWTVPDNVGYVIVVDNKVNNINGSANPTGIVTFTYIRTDADTHGLEGVVEAISLFCLGVVAVVVIIFVVVLVIVLLVRRKNKPVQAPPGAAQGTYGMPTPQQSYQPAPAQYPQQPGQYMPPPAPPGGPGIPPPPGQ